MQGSNTPHSNEYNKPLYRLRYEVVWQWSENKMLTQFCVVKCIYVYMCVYLSISVWHECMCVSISVWLWKCAEKFSAWPNEIWLNEEISDLFSGVEEGLLDRVENVSGVPFICTISHYTGWESPLMFMRVCMCVYLCICVYRCVCAYVCLFISVCRWLDVCHHGCIYFVVCFVICFVIFFAHVL